jgi:cell division protein FtsL
MARGASSIFFTAKSVRRQPTFSPLDKSRNTFLTVVTFLIVLTITGSVFYIGTHVKAVNLGYKINQEVQRKEKIIEENKKLNLEIATLMSPTRIEHEATAQLGFSLPKPNQIIYLSKWEEANLPRETAPVLPEKSPAVKPIPVLTQVFPAQKKETENKTLKKPNPIKEKSPDPGKMQATSKKKTEVIVATIIHDRPTRAPSSSKIAEAKASDIKAKESIPAVMLDSMP